jgi:hypothetical protein
MKLFKKKVLTPRTKRKAFDVYNESPVASPSKVKKLDTDKENAENSGMMTSRRIASMAINLKDKVTRPFATHEQNFAITTLNMENDYEFNKKLYKVDNASTATDGADFDDLIIKEVASPPRIPVDTTNVFSPSKRVLTTDRTRKMLRHISFSEDQSVDQPEEDVGTSYTNFEELSLQLKFSYNDKRFSDVVIRCGLSLEHKFYAHRIILANRSRYFENVFSASALELKAGRFCIDRPAMFAEIFAKVLEYIYVGHVHLRLDNVLEVLSMSEEFGIDSLKTICERFITQNIDSNNASLLLELSRQYHAEQLTAYVLSFIESRENIKHVLASEACANLSPDTLKCIIERDTLQLSAVEEIHIFQAVVNWTKKNGDFQLDEILELIRFPIMTPQQLSDIVEPQGLVPQELLFEAYRHHLVPQKSSHFHRFMHRDRVFYEAPICVVEPIAAKIEIQPIKQANEDDEMVEISLDTCTQ